MTTEYRTVYEGGEGEIVEKKSRFIAAVKPVSAEDEALAFIESVRKRHWNATHNCYAYVIGERSELARCSDDGEPNGTAGKPMLDVLQGEELRNTAVVVTRYFGGTLLGTGGLVRAYAQAVKAGLASSVIITKIRVHGRRREVLVCTDRRPACGAGRIHRLRRVKQAADVESEETAQPKPCRFRYFMAFYNCGPHGPFFYPVLYWNSGSIRPKVPFFLLYTTFTSSVSALQKTKKS